MRNLASLALAALLAVGCALPPPARGVQVFVPAGGASLSSTTLTTLAEAPFVGVAVGQAFFVLANVEIQNSNNTAEQVAIIVDEASSAFAQESIVVLVPASTTVSLTYQLPQTVIGLAAGPYTARLRVQQASNRQLVYTSRSYMGVFDAAGTASAIITLNDLDASAQTLVVDDDCNELTITSATATHTFCLPLDGGADSLALGRGTTAGSNSVAIGQSNAGADGTASVVVGWKSFDSSNDRSTLIGTSAATDGADSTCVGYDCRCDEGAACIGSECQCVTGTFQIGGEGGTEITEVAVGAGDEVGTPSAITFRPNHAGGTDEGGAEIKVVGGAGTGSGAGGRVGFYLCPAGSSGTSVNGCELIMQLVNTTGDLVSSRCTQGCEIGDGAQTWKRSHIDVGEFYTGLEPDAPDGAYIGTAALPWSEIWTSVVRLQDNDVVRVGTGAGTLAGGDWEHFFDGTNWIFRRLLGSGSMIVEDSFTVDGQLHLDPGVQALSAGSTIASTAAAIEVTTSGVGNVTLTSTPTVAAGDGDVLLIVNVDATDNVVLQDETSLTGSNLRLAGGGDLTLGPRDSVTLYYAPTLAEWVQIGSGDN